jgi:hypothetical protein
MLLIRSRGNVVLFGVLQRRDFIWKVSTRSEGKDRYLANQRRLALLPFTENVGVN